MVRKAKGLEISKKKIFREVFNNETTEIKIGRNNTENFDIMRKSAYTLIKVVVLENKRVESRLNVLKEKGFNVKRCYVPTYTSVGNAVRMPRKKVYRVVVGRPKNHMMREVYAIDIDF